MADDVNNLETMEKETEQVHNTVKIETNAKRTGGAGDQKSEQKALQMNKPRASKSKAPELPVHERRNWLIHLHYTRGEYDTCRALIQEQLTETGGLCEYAVYCQAMLLRREGKIQESLELFQTCTIINPNNVDNLKQVALSLYLQGRHKAAIDVYNEALKMQEKDWEIVHNLGVCHMHLGNIELAKENLKLALSYSRHELSYTMLAKVYLLDDDVVGAIDVYQRAVEFSPENPDILSSLGLLLLRTGEFQKAFANLGNAMTFDPQHLKSIMAAGSMMQLHEDYDVALSKYRIAVSTTPESAPLWNNIAMCFFGKKRYIAAITCLKRAHYLAPFDWKVTYNLGLVHLTMQQYASAFHFLRCTIRWRPGLALAYSLLAVALTRLDDSENAQKSYDHALTLDQKDPAISLNYSVFLYNRGDRKMAAKHFSSFEQKMANFQKGKIQLDQELVDVAAKLGPTLQVGENFLWKDNDNDSTRPSQNLVSLENTIAESDT